MSVEAGDELTESMRQRFIRYGEVQEDGISRLDEIVVRLDGFRVVVRTNESQHRGRPHCSIEANDNSATFDIVTGELMVGDLKKLNHTAERVVAEHSDALLKVWNDTRPDDQKL